jgi:hypothetical protein
MVRFYKKVDANYSGPKVTRILVPKVHINGKINIKMRKKTLRTNVEWALYGDQSINKSSYGRLPI